MAHISQKPVSKSVFNKITSQLFSSIQNQKDKSKSFLGNLLTDTEQVMIAKRLAIIFMLIDNISYYKISKILKVSTSTIKRLHNNLLLDEYKEIKRWFNKKKNKELFWKEIESVLRMGLPSYSGRRWTSLSKNQKNK